VLADPEALHYARLAMPRKPSRRKPAKPPRVPGTGRPRATPGRRSRAAAAAKASARTNHGARGSRTSAKPTPKRARTRRRPSPRLAAPRPAPPTRATPRRRARAPRFTPPDPQRVAALLDALDRAYPEARCELDFGSPLQLLIATILSAQCTDERVNKVTPALFAKYPDAAAFANAPQAELEEMIRSTGFYRNKAKAIRSCCADLVRLHGGEVPRTLEALTALQGVGRKTANVVLGNAYGIPGLVVDTHVTRLAHRLGLTREEDAVKIEFALMPIVPRDRWTVFSHWLILHGRRVCNARKPRCSTCTVAALCPRLGVTVSQ
jgi:endonuclease-3